MNKFFKEKSRIIVGFLFFISILPFFGRFFQKEEAFVSKNELFDPSLKYLNSVDKVIGYADEIYNAKHLPVFDTSVYVHVASNTIKERFYHGLATYSFSENWIAYFSGKLIWPHFSAIVSPDDILDHADGLCSQQTVVFMEVLKRKHINVRWVGLGYKEGPGHFLCEVYYNGSWRLHDVTVEPQWRKVVLHHESMEYYLHHKDSLYNVYESRMPKSTFDKITEKVNYGQPNKFPASNMLLFHRITLALTYIFPVFFLVLFIRSYREKKQRKNSKSVLVKKEKAAELV